MGEIRFVGTGETCGYPYLVCKKMISAYIDAFCVEIKGNVLSK